jgi:hypothetical protein
MRRDENGFGFFRNFGNRFRNFSIGFTGNGIFRKRNQFSEFSIGIGIGIDVVFYRPFPSVTGFCQKLPDLCLEIFRNSPACDFFTSSVRLWIRITYFCIFLDGLRFFLGIDGVRRQLRLTIWSLERIHHFLCTVCLFHTLDFRVFM